MLSFDELKKLGELKAQFAKAVGARGHEFSDQELKDIFKEIEKTPKDKRTEGHWQDAIKARTGIRRFQLFEALDFSDIEDIQQQILDLLGKK